ncbi:hypothetical protein J4Q44_G00283750 [Coregonus suidteri]|uniref:EGF-like domain-containing protein n=1 Tax=Coregonus suidteri TaxID=861788 RepID=A0AAN8QST7_9TELE
MPEILWFSRHMQQPTGNIPLRVCGMVSSLPAMARPVSTTAQRGTNICDIPERARCSYTGASAYICSCLPGFVGDGHTCQDIDECEQGRCHRDAGTPSVITLRAPSPVSATLVSMAMASSVPLAPRSVRRRSASETEKASRSPPTQARFPSPPSPHRQSVRSYLRPAWCLRAHPVPR